MLTFHTINCPENLADHAPDTHCQCLDAGGGIVARCSLWWNAAPLMPGERVGVVGHYSAANAEAAHAMLQHAAGRLTAAGCTLAVGPMDGNTWRPYRLVTERGNEPPFLMEPDTPAAWPEHWHGAGFAPLAQYFSALGTDLAHEDAQVSRAALRLTGAGVRLRALRVESFEEELRLIYAVSAESFAGNFLYTPLQEEDFLAQYAAVKERLLPELVLIAEHGGEVLGYSFSIPDWLRGAGTDTIIVKTLAVRPGRQSAGLGAWLLQETQQRAHRLGFRRVIHALMHESNHSLNLSRRFAERFRRYTLYSRRLP